MLSQGPAEESRHVCISQIFVAKGSRLQLASWRATVVINANETAKLNTEFIPSPFKNNSR